MEPERQEEPAEAELELAIGRLLAVTGHAHERQAQLQRALESRVVIEQAKGILAERHQVPLDVAFDALRQGARSTHRKLHDLAGEVTTTRQTPAAIVSALPS
jgi:AmiR/NasT family two-component response regulator